MGNAESAIIRNVDKRTSRREHRDIFEAAAKRFRSAPFAAPSQPADAGAFSRKVRVCIRKRPIFPHEMQQGEFDVVTCLPRRVVVHDARMHPDMIHMFMNHHDFVFDEAFDESADNTSVYTGTVQQLVQAALQGEDGTVMMYGQTGSGKTYTMTAIYQLVARDLFAEVGNREVSVCFIELLGDICCDMLNQGTSCNLASAPDGAVHPYPSVEVVVKEPAELLALIDLATKLRATAATGVHDQSSRSHALCRIFMGADKDVEGSLTLVDLAGSEHRIDNAEHNGERRKEGAKINASLAALKDCIRATAANAKFVAFRQNRLTQLLRGCFASSGVHRTVVIACVSPSSKDTEHSLNTLRHACIMDGQREAKAGPGSHVQGGSVTKELLGQVDVTKIARERKANRKSGETQGGRSDDWVKPAPPAHQAKQSNTAARASLDRRFVQRLPPRVARDLLEARGSFGTIKQRMRFSRAAPVDEISTDEAPSAGGSNRRSSSKTANNSGDRATSGNTDPSGGSCAATNQGEKVPQPDVEKAFELFRAFCNSGRTAREWRKNDLRLINTCVLPMLYGPGTQIEWTHPNMALDELEQLIAQQAQSVHCIARDAPDQGEAQPPEHDESSLLDQREDRSQRPPPLPSSAPSTAGQQVEVSESGASRPRGRSRLLARSASPAQRAPQTPSLDPSVCVEPKSDSRGSGSAHHNAIRARREALEEQRRQSLQHALAKHGVAPQSRSEEIESVQQQLAAGNCSAAAAIGLKRRLATLRAAALREQRAAAHGQAANIYSDEAGDPGGPQAIGDGTPRTGDGATPNNSAYGLDDAGVSQDPEQSPTRHAGIVKQRLHAARGTVGAASAPWANECVDEVGLMAG